MKIAWKILLWKCIWIHDPYNVLKERRISSKYGRDFLLVFTVCPKFFFKFFLNLNHFKVSYFLKIALNILCLVYILVETRQERECEGYIRLVFHTLDLFSSCLEALGDMSVNQSRVKENENVSNVLPHYRWFSHASVNVCLCSCVLRLIHISPKVSMSTWDENVNQALRFSFKCFYIFILLRKLYYKAVIVINWRSVGLTYIFEKYVKWEHVSSGWIIYYIVFKNFVTWVVINLLSCFSFVCMCV